MNDQSNLKDQICTPILVRSAGGRSGTSRMMELLGSSDEIQFDRRHPYEVRLLSYVYRLAKIPFVKTRSEGWCNESLVTGSVNSVGPLPVRTDLIKSPAQLSKKLFQANWDCLTGSFEPSEDGHLPKYYAEKTPSDVHNAVSRWLPCRTIWLARDPRDEFASILSFNKKRNSYGFGWVEGDTEMSFAVRFTTRRKAYLKQVFDTGENDQNKIVYFSDLVSAPSEIVARLSDWLSVDLSVVESKQSEKQKHTTSKTFSEAVGRWEKDLSSEVAGYIGSELRNELEMLFSR